MIDKRRAQRRAVDLGVRMIVDGEPHPCRACEISPAGIRLSADEDNPLQELVELELPLVEGQLTTLLTARHVRSDNAFDAFEFIDATYAQQTILERVYCPC